MNSIALCDQITKIRDSIREFEQRYHRQENSVELLAVSKKQPVASILEAMHCGQHKFGENYAQEMVEKARIIGQEVVQWHFIGPIQSNKTRLLSETVNWVHSVDRLKIARRLNDQRPADKPMLNICLQVNLDNEENKSGVKLAQLPELADAVARLSRINLRGLMAIPKPATDFAAQRASFRRLRTAQEALIENGLQLDTLSMGMTADYEAAIAEGATIIRVGTALFGPRR